MSSVTRIALKADDRAVRCTDEECAAHPGLHEPFESTCGAWCVEHVSNFGPSPKRWRQPVAAPALACVQCRGTYDVHGVKQLGAIVNLCGYCDGPA